jgi:hypothetical protein
MMIVPNSSFWYWGTMLTGVAMLTSACDFSNAQDRNLAQERACGNQAVRVFEREWPGPRELGAVWESHYNNQLNRCLILITWIDGGTKETPDNYQSGVVVDAHTRHVFAEYRGRYPLKEKEMPMCVLKEQGWMCRSFDEFKQLVITHFGFDQ